MIKVICDRCKKEIEGTSYYTIDIYAADIEPQSKWTSSMDTASQNVKTNMMSLYNAKPQYCKKCKSEIEDFIKNKNMWSRV